MPVSLQKIDWYKLFCLVDDLDCRLGVQTVWTLCEFMHGERRSIHVDQWHECQLQIDAAKKNAKTQKDLQTLWELEMALQQKVR